MEKVKLSTLRPNPDNPRTMTAHKLKKLENSIADFTRMMELRPIVVDETGQVLGGNQRLLALKGLNYKEVPASWIKRAEDLTEDEKRRFIVADNVTFGEWDFEELQLQYERVELQDMGVDLPPLELEIPEEPAEQKKPKEARLICCPECGAELDLNI